MMSLDNDRVRNCPSNHWNNGDDYCADCGKDLNPSDDPVQAVRAQQVVAYADPKAFTNFRNGTATKEWMWASPDKGLIPLVRASAKQADAGEAVALRYTHDGALAECPCCGSLDVGGANHTVHCYKCGLKIEKDGPLQNACDAWNERTGRTHPSAGAVPEAVKAIADKLEQVEGKSAEGGYMWDARECADFIREEADKLNSAPTAPAVQSGEVPDYVWEALQRLIENSGQLGPASREDALVVAKHRQALLTHPHNTEQGESELAHWLGTLPDDAEVSLTVKALKDFLADSQPSVTDGWIKVIEAQCWDLRCTSEPTGGDDYDVLWHVIEHHMAEPHERTLASDLCPVRALERALNLGGDHEAG